MTPDSSSNKGRPRGLGRLAMPGALIIGALMLAGCGGGDDSPGASTSTMNQVAANQQGQNGNQPYVDPIAYSSNEVGS